MLLMAVLELMMIPLKIIVVGFVVLVSLISGTCKK